MNVGEMNYNPNRKAIPRDGQGKVGDQPDGNTDVATGPPPGQPAQPSGPAASGSAGGSGGSGASGSAGSSGSPGGGANQTHCYKIEVTAGVQSRGRRCPVHEKVL